MASSRQLQKLTRDDVAKHNKHDDLVRTFPLQSLSPRLHPVYFQWVIIDSKVYDLTRFKNLHPGGAAVLLDDDIGSQIISPIANHFTLHPVPNLRSGPGRDRRLLRSPSSRGPRTTTIPTPPNRLH